jgi:hypothetical protein
MIIQDYIAEEAYELTVKKVNKKQTNLKQTH